MLGARNAQNSASEKRSTGHIPVGPSHAFSAPSDAGCSTRSERRRLTWSHLQPAYRSPAYRCATCCDRCQQVLSTRGASNTGSGGLPLFFSRHRGAGPTRDGVRPARSRGEAFEQRCGVAAGSEPARTVVEGRVRLLGFRGPTTVRTRINMYIRTHPHAAQVIRTRPKSSAPIRGATHTSAPIRTPSAPTPAPLQNPSARQNTRS